ncbi:MAG: hypothetical protein DSZ26_03710 [Thermovibrio sp.]|nr:MAG: hypothetical protein DSZ26_03710 [Thermovibrio sp.]
MLKALLSYASENKKRFLLSIIGIAIGVFTLTLMLGISSAMKKRVEFVIGKMGSSVLVVLPGDVKNLGGRTIQLSFYPTLKISDAEAIEEKCPDVLYVSPYKKVSPNVHYGGKSYSASVYGIWPEYRNIANLEFLCGRFLSKEDVDGISQRAVLGYSVARELYGSTCPVGKVIYLFNAPYRIVGVLKKKGTDLSGENLDDRVYIPISSAVKRISNVDYIDGIYILPDSPELVDTVKKEVEGLLLKRHKKKDFSVNKYEDLVNTQKQAMDVFKKLSLIVSFISFGTGALGIIAVLTLSVYERYVEIGIRRAFGATKGAIFKQFLYEATFLSSVGALMGAFLSTLLVIGIAKVAHWPVYIPLKEAFFSIVLSSLIGLISGVYPAVRALSVDPKEVLKEE